MPTKPMSKAEQRARRIGELQIDGYSDDGFTEVNLIRYAANGNVEVCIGSAGDTRAEAIRNVLRAVDRLAKRVERSRS